MIRIILLNVVLATVLTLQVAIKCKYIQWGFGHVHFEHPRCGK